MVARQIDAATNIVVMCGNGCHGAADELRALSDRLKAPLIHSFKGKDITVILVFCCAAPLVWLFSTLVVYGLRSFL